MEIGEISFVSKHDLTDRELCRFWHNVRESGRDGITMYGMDPVTDQGFADFVRDPGLSFWMVRAEGVDFAAIWLTDRRGACADVHFCALPVGLSHTGDKVPLVIAAGRQAFDMIFGLKGPSGEPVFRWLISKIPACNRSALKLVSKLGGVPCGVIPGGALFRADGRNVDLVINKFERA